MNALVASTLERLNNNWPMWALIASIGALGYAYFIQFGLGYQPCRLCYIQRWPFWAAIAIAGAALIMHRYRPDHPSLRALDYMLAGVFLTGAVIALYHAGVEWKILPDPGCDSGGARLSVDELIAGQTTAGKAQSCADAPFHFPFERFGLSMAGWNVVFSSALAALSLRAARRTQMNWEANSV